MRRLLIRLMPLMALLGLGGSSVSNLADPIDDHEIAIDARRLDTPHFVTSKRLRFVDGWQLRARDADFGGLSGLLVQPNGLLALSDKGALIELQFARGQPARARIRPLPKGCAPGPLRLHRDSESIAHESEGQVWLGFEVRNVICRATAALDRATAVGAPTQMQGWPATGGAEAMTRLRDGRTVVIAERSARGDAGRPMLVFADDPATSAARAVELSYLPPAGYRPTDIAELPDRSLAVLHRRFRLPFTFSAILGIVPASRLASSEAIQSEAIALLKAPGIADNFEGLAVERRGGRTYLWLVSDDNFAPLQSTYLLKFELRGN